MAIQVTAADATGASGTTSRTKKFSVKLFRGSTALLSVPATPSAGKWSVKWPGAPLPAGDYKAVAGTGFKLFTVTAVPPPPPPPPPPSGRWYSDASPFNNPVHTAQHPNSAAIISRIRGQGAFTKIHIGYGLNNPADFTHPIYFPAPDAPTFTLRQGKNGQWVNPDVEGAKLPFPSYAKPAGGSDHSLATVFTNAAGERWEYDLWNADAPANGEVHCGFAKRNRFDGDGLQHGDQGGITAAGYSNGLGLILLDELKTGRIPHALFAAINGWHLRCYPGQSGGQHSGEVSDPNAPNMGALIQLNMTETAIRALNRPTWQTAILIAQAEYGMFVGDQSGSVIALQPESGVSYVAAGKPDPWVQWAATVGITNNILDWTVGVDWSKLRVLNPPTP